jgi:hypothetical protein
MGRIARLELAAVTLVAVTSAAIAWTLPRPVSAGLLGRYWTNPSWRGAPAVETGGALPQDTDVVRRLPDSRTTACHAQPLEQLEAV